MNEWVVELMPVPPAKDEIYRMIVANHPGVFDTWERMRQTSIDPETKNVIPPSSFEDALERAAHMARNWEHIRVRLVNVNTGQIIPGEILCV